MNGQDIENVVKMQRAYFNSGATLPIRSRRAHLQRLKNTILEMENEIQDALRKDLGKSSFESFMSEIGLALEEIDYMLKNLAAFARVRTVPTPIGQFASRSYVKKSPYGVVLIMSPWNYPFLLTIDPLVDAIAAGNTAVVKPSNYSPHTGALLLKLLTKCFDGKDVTVVMGGREENQALLQQKFDYIFFTGSQRVGKEVMKNAAEHLTPVTLELGGKSPCIVDSTADIGLAAKRIVFGKFLNLGQTCVSPDYVLCQSEVKDAFVNEVKKQIGLQFGEDVFSNANYGKIINEKHFDRILRLLDSRKIVCGGRSDRALLKIEPTVMTDVCMEDAVMQEEIFGPVLPILTFDSLNDAIGIVQEGQRPLALYLFSGEKKNIEFITDRCTFGGGCINDTLVHLGTSHMGFGGVGESGMGAYHGKTGFDTFSHAKSIVDKKTFMDLPIRYQPYTKRKERLLKLFM